MPLFAMHAGVLPFRLLVCGIASALLIVSGCNRSSAPLEHKAARQRAERSADHATQRPTARPKPNGERKIAVNAPIGPGPDGQLSALAAADLVWKAVTESMVYGDVAVAWIFDSSSSAQSLTSQVSQHLASYYGADAPHDDAAHAIANAAGTEHELQSVVVAVGREVDFLIPEPTADRQQVAEAFAQLRVDATGQERLFTAIQQALDRLLPLRQQRGVKVMLVLVTDEAGDDAALAESLVDTLRRESVPLYVIGSPAPWGRIAATSPAAERAEGDPPDANWLAVRHGPESRSLEHVRFLSLLSLVDQQPIDSGFGPFALEWLCRSGGGVYLAVRPPMVEGFTGLYGDSWPTSYAPRFSREALRGYAPDYVSQAEYDRMLADNSAMRALHEAARLGPVPVLSTPQLQFVKTDEAQLSRTLGEAQKEPARVTPLIQQVYELLNRGASDREQIVARRWQAAFDLALARAGKAKVQVESYNGMLARLKRGMAFQQASSTTWVLEPSDDVDDSSLQKIAARSRDLLMQIVAQHPGTPWAAVAQQELASPPGWKWTER